jgi:hypothetical protein
MQYVGVDAGNQAGENRFLRQRRGCQGETTMMKNFDDLQKHSKDHMDVAMKSVGATTKSVQAIAAEVTNYSKKSFEDGTAALEKLFGVKSVEKAIELQTEYAKSSYEGFVAQATKLGQLYTDLAREAYKPYEGYLAKVMPAK